METLEQALQWVQNYTNVADLFERLGHMPHERKEKQMGVHAIQQAVPNLNAEIAKQLKRIQGTLKSLGKHQTQTTNELTRQAIQLRIKQAPPSQQRQNKDHIKCFANVRFGHMARDCRKRLIRGIG